jgi:TP901 family phage tail tape measure protein
MADVVVTVGGDTVPFEEAINRATSKKRSIGGLDVKGFSQPLGRITGQASEFTKSLEAANARVIAFGASAGAIALLKVGFDKLLSSTIEVEKSLVDINTLLNVSSRDLKKFGAGLFEIANQTSVSFRDAAEAATEFSRQGLGAAETLGRTKAAMILAKLSGTDFAQSVNSLTAAINSFKKESLEAIDIVNRLAAVDARFAVSADDLAEGIKRVGSSAADSNVTLNQTIALITSAQQTTARGGAVIGNSFKTIFTRLQRPGVLKQLEEVGVRTKEASGEIRPLIDVLADLSKKYDKLAPSQRAYTAEVVGGVFQINVLKAIMSDLGGGFSVYEGALKAATGATGEAENRINQLNQTISGKLIQTLNSFQQFGAAVGGSGFADVIKQGLDAASSAGGSLTSGLDAEGMGGDLARGVMKGLANVISGPGVQLITFTILKLFQKLASFGADAVKGFLRVGSAAEKLENVQKAAFTFLQKHPELLAKVANGTMKVEDVQRLITTEIGQQNVLLREQERLSLVIAKKMVAGGASTVAAPTMMGRAKGYIPNFNDFSREEQEARSLGASAGVRGKMGRGTIGGQKFVMNNQEIEIPGFGRNGDSAVIPQYSGGHVPNFATKVLDRDHLRQLFGSKKGETDKVFEAIAGKAAQANAISNIITGAPGIGKTTLAMQQGGKLISSAGQFNPAKDDLVILRALVTSGLDKPENKEVFGAAKQITGLRGSAGLIEKMRGMRDSEIVAGTSKTGFGRKPGSTKGANSSSLVSEALLNDKFGSKFKLFERGDDFSLKELTERTGIEDFEASVLMGAFSPFTKGHEKLLKSATKKPIAFVAGGVNREDDVGLSVSEKKKMIGKAFGIPTVSGERGVPIAAPGGEYAFESGGKVMRFDTRSSEIVLGADRADDEAFTKKFKSQGLAINTKDKSRISSGTSVRGAIVNGDMSFLKNNLASPIYDMVEGNLSTLQERARLIKGRKVGAADHVADLNAEYDAVGRRKKPKEDPAITAKRDAIRKKLKFFESRLKGKVKSRVFDRMGLQLNLAGGHVPNFAKKVDNLSQTASVNHRMTGDKEEVSLRQALQMIEKNHLTKRGATAGFGKEAVDKAFDVVARAGRIHKAGKERKDLESKPEGSYNRDQVGFYMNYAKVKSVVEGRGRGRVDKEDTISPSGNLSDVRTLSHIIKGIPTKDMQYEKFVFDNKEKINIGDLALGHSKFSGGIMSAVDAYSPAKRAFIEIKGGKYAPGGGSKDVKDKFPRAVIEDFDSSIVKSLLNGGFTEGQDNFNINRILVRNKAAGFIPNFNALGDAVSREQAAGLSASSIRVGSDASLVNAGNPGGLGVYNTTQETSLKDGMSKARAAGINPKNKGRAAGFIPNFAENDFAFSSALGTLQFLIPQMQMMGAGSQKLSNDLRISGDEIAKLTGEINELKNAAGTGKSEIKGMREERTKRQAGLKKLEREAESLPKDGGMKEVYNKFNPGEGMGDKKMGGQIIPLAHKEGGSKMVLRPMKKKDVEKADRINEARTTEEDAIKKLTAAIKAQTASVGKAKSGIQPREAKLDAATVTNKAAQAAIDKKDKKDKWRSKVTQTGFILSASMSGLAGMIDSMGPDISSTKDEMVGYATAASQGAQVMAAIPGPLGMVAAAATFLWGAMATHNKSLVGVSDATKIQRKQIIENAQRASASTTLYVSATNEYNEALKRGVGVQNDLIRIGKKRLNAEASLLTAAPEVLAKLKAASNPKELGQASSEAGEILANRQRDAENATKLDKDVKDATGGIEKFGVIGLTKTKEDVHTEALSARDKVVSAISTEDKEKIMKGEMSVKDAVANITGPMKRQLDALGSQARAGNLSLGPLNASLKQWAKTLKDNTALANEQMEAYKKLDFSMVGQLDRLKEFSLAVKKSGEVNRKSKSLSTIQSGANNFDLSAQIAGLFNDNAAQRNAERQGKLASGFADISTKNLKDVDKDIFSSSSPSDSKILDKFASIFSAAGEGGLSGIRGSQQTLANLAAGGENAELAKLKFFPDASKTDLKHIQQAATALYKANKEALPKLLREEEIANSKADKMLALQRSLSVGGGSGARFDTDAQDKRIEAFALGQMKASGGRSSFVRGQGEVESFKAMEQIVGKENVSRSTREAGANKALPGVMQDIKTGLLRARAGAASPEARRDIDRQLDPSKLRESAVNQTRQMFGLSPGVGKEKDSPFTKAIASFENALNSFEDSFAKNAGRVISQSIETFLNKNKSRPQLEESQRFSQKNALAQTEKKFEKMADLTESKDKIKALKKARDEGTDYADPEGAAQDLKAEQQNVKNLSEEIKQLETSAQGSNADYITVTKKLAELGGTEQVGGARAKELSGTDKKGNPNGLNAVAVALSQGNLPYSNAIDKNVKEFTPPEIPTESQRNQKYGDASKNTYMDLSKGNPIKAPKEMRYVGNMGGSFSSHMSPGSFEKGSKEEGLHSEVQSRMNKIDKLKTLRKKDMPDANSLQTDSRDALQEKLTQEIRLLVDEFKNLKTGTDPKDTAAAPTPDVASVNGGLTVSIEGGDFFSKEAQNAIASITRDAANKAFMDGIAAMNKKPNPSKVEVA